MKALLLIPAAVICAALGFAAASCGSDEATSAGPVPSVTEPAAGGTETGAPTETAPATATTEGEDTGTGEDPDPAPITYQVWFNDGERSLRHLPDRGGTPRIGTAALESLLAGPNDFERGYGLTTAMPQGTSLLGLSIENGIASVDLTSEFESGGGTLSMQARLAQVVYTLTQFPTVKGVLLRLDGERVDVIGGEGILIDRPLRRKDFAELLPAILVTSPALVQRVANPVVVSGSANVFEANVTVEVLDSTGQGRSRARSRPLRAARAAAARIPSPSRTRSTKSRKARSSSTTTTRPAPDGLRTRCASRSRSRPLSTGEEIGERGGPNGRHDHPDRARPAIESALPCSSGPGAATRRPSPP